MKLWIGQNAPNDEYICAHTISQARRLYFQINPIEIVIDATLTNYKELLNWFKNIVQTNKPIIIINNKEEYNDT